MIPRYSNPHLLSQAFSVQKVSRNLLFQESYSTASHLQDEQTLATEINEQERADLLKGLNKRVLEEFEFNLGLSYENERKDTIQGLPPDDADQGRRKRKRRNLENITKKQDTSFRRCLALHKFSILLVTSLSLQTFLQDRKDDPTRTWASETSTLV